MRILFLLILILLFAAPNSALAYAECTEGFERCERLKPQEKFYERCMNLMCDPNFSNKQPASSSKAVPTKSKSGKQSSNKPSNIKKKDEKPLYNMAASATCNSGLRRCDKLRVRPKDYWQCMKDTCTDARMREAPLRCSNGIKACKRYSDEFGTCLKLNCSNKTPTIKNCPLAKNLCSSAINEYWDCMAQVCVGSIEAYIEDKPFSEDEEKMLKDELRYDFKGDIIKPEKGVHSSKRYPPKGVRAEDWNVITPPQRMYVGNPGNTLICPMSILGEAVRLTCLTRDIKSCHCSDGTTPVFKPVYKNAEKKPDPKEFTPEKWADLQSTIVAMSYSIPQINNDKDNIAGQKYFMDMVKIFEEETGIDFMVLLEGWGKDSYKIIKSNAEKDESGQ